MGRYRDDSAALRALVREDRVHRDVYTDAEIFQLEMERLWTRTWVYAGHASQVSRPGDYITVDIAAQPLIVVRHTDGSIRVLRNRCAHKGSKVLGDAAGNCGKVLRCPYHAWTYRTDGSLVNIPLRQGYDGTRLQETESVRGLAPVPRARRIIDHCAHPAYRDYLHHYLESSPPGHIRHDLRRCFELHANYLETGAMLPGLDLSQFGPR